MESNCPAPYPYFVIIGPTAVGKTALSLRLAKEIRAEIINVDSVQIYKGLDIGSAKPSVQEMSEVPHHLVDILLPYEPFSVADFLRLARVTIKKILKKGKTVVLSGGTGLYINAFLNGLSPCPGRDLSIRHMLEKYRERFGTASLFNLLEKTDPESASRLHKNDTYRVLRALEVFYVTGSNISSWWAKKPVKKIKTGMVDGRHVVKIGLMRPRDELYRRVDMRVDQMMEKGFVDEVKNLLEQGYSPALKPLRSLGYNQIARYLSGEITLDQAVYEIKRDSRHYAKRQITWFRAMPGVKWCHPEKLLEQKKITTLIF